MKPWAETTCLVLLAAAWVFVLLLVLALFRAAQEADEAYEKAEHEYRLRREADGRDRQSTVVCTLPLETPAVTLTRAARRAASSKEKIMKRGLVYKSLFLLTLALAPAATASNVWYVDGVHGSDQNDCKTRQTACKTIGHAISLASSGDTIGVGSATYSENLTISISLKIIGSGAATTIIDGGGLQTVVVIQSGSQVALSALTVQNGSNCGTFLGAGVVNNGMLTVNSSAISGNSTIGFGGGLYNSGTLILNKTTISGNNAGGIGCGGYGDGEGGGIYNVGTMTLVASTISGNTARGACIGGECFYSSGHGGGVYNDAVLTIVNSTITGNAAEAGNGFKFRTATGGGIDNEGTIAISNSTLSGNSAEGGSQYAHGGNIYNSSAYTVIQNSIVANSTAGRNCFGGMNSHGYNLSSDSSCSFNGPGDLNNTDPKLGPLQNNGGPTQTQALLSGSPAIDAGNPAGCTDGRGHLLATDQRGMPRPDPEDSGGCDMGAYESQSD